MQVEGGAAPPRPAPAPAPGAATHAAIASSVAAFSLARFFSSSSAAFLAASRAFWRALASA
jgi:hypothetical protein